MDLEQGEKPGFLLRIVWFIEDQQVLDVWSYARTG